MTDKLNDREYAKVIANNLRRIMYENGKTQADLSRELHISKATLSSWMNGTRIPRMPNVDMLCHYFNVSRADIMEKHVEGENSTLKKEYYKDAAIVAQKILENRELQLLFEDAVDAKPDDLQTAHSVLLAMKRKERGND